MKVRRILTALIAAVTFSTLALASPAAAASTPGPSYNVTFTSGVTAHAAFPFQWLNAGSTWTFGSAHMTMQTDGNLVVYRRDNSVKWASNTAGTSARQMQWTPGGALTLVNSAGKLVKTIHSNTCNVANSDSWVIALQSDSNFVIYCGYHTKSGQLDYYHPTFATGAF
jgi:hypothetical protein